MLPRLGDWPQRLSAHCQLWNNTPHDWNGADCVTFAADAVLAISGVDPIEDLRGRWTTRSGALRVIKNEGFSSLSEIVASRFEECRIDEVGRGDIVMCPGEAGEFVAVVMGHYAVAPGEHGLMQVSLQFAERGFKV